MLAVKVKIYWKNKDGKFVSFSFGNVCTRSMVMFVQDPSINH